LKRFLVSSLILGLWITSAAAFSVTPNYGLYLPAYNDPPAVYQPGMSTNFSILDAVIAALSQLSVSNSITINGHPLSAPVVISASDLTTGTLPFAQLPSNLVTLLGLTNSLQFQGTLDASGDPNYPSASIGYMWIISKAGLIGGGSGAAVSAGDMVICITANAGGTQALVGADFTIVHTSAGAAFGPASSVSGNFPSFNGTSGNLLQDSGENAASFAAAGASTTVNGQTCALGGSCSITDSSKVPVVSNVKTYMGATEQSVSVTSNAATCNWGSGSSCVITLQNAATAWTLTMTNPVAGQVYRMWFLQNTTGGSSAAPLPTFSPSVTWAGGSAPTLTTTASKRDIVTCYWSAVLSGGYLCDVDQNF
jgi:hypothetical protein